MRAIDIDTLEWFQIKCVGLNEPMILIRKPHILELDIIEAEPVRHAQWESYPGRAYRRCSLCKKEFEKAKFGVRANYCPNCGAKMDKETIIKVTKPDCEECEHFKWHDPECGSCNEENGYRYFKHA